MQLSLIHIIAIFSLLVHFTPIAQHKNHRTLVRKDTLPYQIRYTSLEIMASLGFKCPKWDKVNSVQEPQILQAT